MRWYLTGTAVICIMMLFLEASFLKKPDAEFASFVAPLLTSIE